MFERRGRGERLSPGSEGELVRAVARGSDDAMAQIYQRHGGLIYRFCLRMVRDESIAEEVTQDVFLALLRQAGSFDQERAALATWLCGIARRLVWKQMERQQRHLPPESAEGSREPESREDDPGVLLSRKQTVSVVQRGIDALPPDGREVIVLCEFEEMSYEEAAMVMGVPVGTVRSRLNRAKSRLATLLRSESVGAGGKIL